MSTGLSTGLPDLSLNQNYPPGGGPAPPTPGADAILREDSGYVLREDGTRFLRE